MKKQITLIGILLILLYSMSLQAKEIPSKKSSNIPDSAAYLGQTPPGETPVIFAPGIVSLPDRDEPSMTISPDGKLILFYIGFYPKPGDPFIMQMQYINGKWTSPEKIPFCNGRRTGEPFFALDGNRLYMFSNKSTNQVSYVDLAYVEKQDSTWSNPISLGNPPNQYTDQYHPCIVADGSIYFSNSSGEICRTQFENGAFQPCIVLPYPINHANTSPTWGDPYVSPNEDYMIFKSSRKGGFGQNDIYISYKKDEGSWTNPKNLGDKINTPEDETSGDITPDGKYMTYGSKGDIYWVSSSFIEKLKHTNFVPYLNGKIPNQSYPISQPFNFTVSEKTFIDDDGNNTLSYSSTLEDGNPLPTWLSFKPDTRTFSGTPVEKGINKVKVIVTDKAGAVASAVLTIEVI